MRFPSWTAVAVALVLTGCWDEQQLPDTLFFPPGMTIDFQGASAKLYGTSQCAQGALTGHSCLIFPPQAPSATGLIVMDGKVRELMLTAKRDPDDPTRYVILDEKGKRLLSTNGRHDEFANIELAP